MIISACSTSVGSASLSFSCNVKEKTAYYEVLLHIVGAKYERDTYTDFPAAVDAYNAAVVKLKAMEG